MKFRVPILVLWILPLIASSVQAAPIYTWGHTYGNDADQTLAAVAVDPFGNVLLCGTFFGSITFSTTHNSAGSSDMFVAKLDPAGNPLWSKRIGSFLPDTGWDVTSDPVGNVIAVESSFTNGASIVIAKWAPDGTHRWTKNLGGGSPDYVERVTTNAAKEVIVAGRFSGFLYVGEDTLESSDQDLFLIKFDQNGEPVWGKDFVAGPETMCKGLDVDMEGNIVMFGQFGGTIAFDDTLHAAGLSDVYLARFTTSGATMWSARYGGPSTDIAACSALSESGRPVIAANMDGLIDFGGGVITPAVSSEPLVALFTSSGTHVWSKTFDSSQYGFALSMAFAQNSDLLLSCHGVGTIDFGSGPISATGTGENTFVARLFQDTGSARWGAAYAGDGNLYGFVEESQNGIVLAGTTGGEVDLGGGPLPYSGEGDVYAARFGDVLTKVGAHPVAGSLEQNIPNPFNPTTTIRYTLDSPAKVVIGIYNVNGQAVRRIVEPVRSAGPHSVVWNGRDDNGRAVASGVYFYRLEGAPGLAARKMVLLK